MRARWTFLAFLPLIIVPSAAHATSTVVPDQFSTIQGAIDSGADSIFVRAGVYPESLSLTGPRALISLPTDSYGGPSLALPYVTALSWSCNWDNILRGFCFKHGVTTSGGGGLQVEGCWFEAGLCCGNVGGYLQIWHNFIFGVATFMGGAKFDIAMNTIIGGTVSYNPIGDGRLHDNVVVGPAPVGIVAWSDANAVHNYVRGCATGIENHTEFSKAIENIVEDCSGTGIICSGNYHMGVIGNTVRRCGGVGIDVGNGGGSGAEVTGNTVDSVGSIGIRVTGGSARLSGNTVRGAGGDGMLAVPAIPSTVTGNVVGRSAGRGIAVQSTFENTLTGNTSYANGAAGFDVSGAWYTSIHNNIAYGNGGYGLVWSGSGTLDLSCNDWCENDAGTVSRAEPGATLVIHGQDGSTLLVGTASPSN